MDWPGRQCRARPMMISVVVASRKPAGSAEAASAPRSAATAAATTATATTATAAATATATATATAPRDLRAALGRRGVLLVEHVERRQADVGDFFNAKHLLMIERSGRRHRH